MCHGAAQANGVDGDVTILSRIAGSYERLPYTAAVAFGSAPRVLVHLASSYLGVRLVGPRLAELASDRFGSGRGYRVSGLSHAPSPGVMLQRDPAI
jgi:hypothetical protein